MGKKFEQQFNQQFGGYQEQKSKNREGSTIDKKPKGRKRSDKKVGEYIDYEEID